MLGYHVGMPADLRNLSENVLKAFQTSQFDAFYEYIPGKQASRFNVSGTIFDIAAGPDTPLGTSIELVARSGALRPIGPTAIAQRPELTDPITLRLLDPTQSLVQAVSASHAYNQPLERILSQGTGAGAQEHPFPGGIQTYGPNHPYAARQDYASRISVFMGRGVYSDEVSKEFYRMAGLRGTGEGWSRVLGYHPHMGDDDIFRFARWPYTRGGVTDAEYLSFTGGAGVKDIKHRNINLGYRETLNTLYQQQGRNWAPVEPARVMQRTTQPQWAWSNAILPGDVAARPSIMMNEAIGMFPFLPGTGLGYEGMFEGGFAYEKPGSEIIKVPFEHITDFQKARIKLIENIKGQRVPAGSTLEIGRAYFGPEKKVPTEGGIPINITAGAHDLILGNVHMQMPLAYYKSGRPAPMEAMGISTKSLLEEQRSRYAQMGLSDIRRVSQGGFNIVVSTNELLLPALKTGQKAAFNYITGLNKQTVMMGGKETPIDFYNPEVKNIVPRFISAFGAMTHKQQLTALGMVSKDLGQDLKSFAQNAFVSQAGQPAPMAWNVLARQAGMSEPELAHRMLTSILSEKNRDMSERNLGIAMKEVTMQRIVSSGLRETYSDYLVRAGLDPRVNMTHEQLLGPKGLVDFTRPQGVVGKDEWLMSTKMRALVMRTATPPSPEWAGSATVNEMMMTSIRTAFPGLASWLGLGTERQYVPRDVGSFALRQAGAVYAHNVAGEQLPTANVINPREATRLLANLEGIPQDLPPNVLMEEYEKVLGTKPMYFESLNANLISPKAIRGMELERFGESITGFAPMYQRAVRQALEAEAHGQPGNVLMGQGSPFQMLTSKIEGQMGSSGFGKGYGKKIFGRQVRGAVGGRYGAFERLAVNEIYVPTDTLSRMIYDLGGLHAQERGLAAERYYNIREQIAEQGYIPGVFQRQPVLSKGAGAVPVKIITEDILKQRGIDVPSGKDAMGRAVLAYVHPDMGITGVKGDFDYDFASIIPAARVVKGKLITGLSSDPAYASLINATEGAFTKRIRKLHRPFEIGTGGTYYTRGENDPTVPAELLDSAVDYAMSHKGSIYGAYPLGGLDKMDWVDRQEIYMGGSRTISAKAGMASSYTLRERMFAAGDVLGTYSKKMLTEMFDETAGLYQKYIDKSRTTATYLEQMFRTIHFNRQGTLQTMVSTGKGKMEPSMIASTHQTPNTPPTAFGSYFHMISGVMRDWQMAKGDLPTAPLAYMLSTGEQSMKEIQAIMEANKGSKEGLFMSLSKYMSAQDTNLFDTPLGFSLLGSAVQRAYVKPDPKSGGMLWDRISTRYLNYRGQGTSLNELLWDPQLQMNNIFNNFLRRLGSPSPEAMRMAYRFRENMVNAESMVSQLGWEYDPAVSIAMGSRRETVGMKQRRFLSQGPFSIGAHELGRLASANPAGVALGAGWGEQALGFKAIGMFGRSHRDLLQMQAYDPLDDPLRRGKLVESMYRYSTSQTERGYYFGSGKPMSLDVTLPGGEYATLKNITDFMQITDKGITITDVKSTEASIEKLKKNEVYRTQLAVTSQTMQILAEKDPEYLAKWMRERKVSEADIAKALQHAKAGNISGRLLRFGAEITPSHVAMGAKGDYVDMGNLDKIDVFGQVKQAVANIKAAYGPSEALLQNILRAGDEGLRSGRYFYTADSRDRIEGLIRSMNMQRFAQTIPMPPSALGRSFAKNTNSFLPPDFGFGHDPNKEYVDIFTGANETPASTGPNEIGQVRQKRDSTPVPSDPIWNKYASDIQNLSTVTGFESLLKTMLNDPKFYDIESRLKARVGAAAGVDPDVLGTMSWEQVKAEAAFLSPMQKAAALYPERHVLKTFERMHGKMAAINKAMKSSGLSTGSQPEDMTAEEAEQFMMFEKTEEFLKGQGLFGIEAIEYSAMSSTYGGTENYFKAVESLKVTTEKLDSAMQKLTETVTAHDAAVREVEGRPWSPSAQKGLRVAQAQRAAGMASVDRIISEGALEQMQALGIEGEPLFRQQRQLAARRMAEREAAQGLRRAEAEPAGAGIGRGLRRLMGGFGLMFLGSMFGFGASSFQQGMEETEGLFDVMRQTGRAQFGAGFQAPRSAAMAQLRAAMFGGGTVGRQWALDTASLTSMGLSDVLGIGKTSLGAFAGLSFASTAMGGMQTLAGGIAGTLAVPAAALAGVGAAAYTAYSYAKDPTMEAQIALQQRKGTLGGEISAAWKSWTTAAGRAVTEPWARGAFISQPEEKIIPQMRDVLAGSQATSRAYDQFLRTGRVPSGYNISTMAFMYAGEEFPELDPRLVESGFLQNLAAGWDTGRMKTVMSQYAAGFDTSQLAGRYLQTLGMLGRVPTISAQGLFGSTAGAIQRAEAGVAGLGTLGPTAMQHVVDRYGWQSAMVYGQQAYAARGVGGILFSQVAGAGGLMDQRAALGLGMGLPDVSRYTDMGIMEAPYESYKQELLRGSTELAYAYRNLTDRPVGPARFENAFKEQLSTLAGQRQLTAGINLMERYQTAGLDIGDFDTTLTDLLDPSTRALKEQQLSFAQGIGAMTTAPVAVTNRIMRAGLTPSQMQFSQRLMQGFLGGDPYTYAKWGQGVLQQFFQSQGMTAPEGMLIPAGTNMAGQLVPGVAPLQQSLGMYDAMGNYVSPQQMAPMIWGAEAVASDPFGLIGAAIETTLPSGTKIGGLTAMAYQHQMNQAGYAMAGAANSLAQLQLSYQYQTMPGGFWDIQDQMTALSREQQQWGFEYQQMQMELAASQFAENQAFASKTFYAQQELQASQFYEQIGLAQRGSMVTREYTQEQWGFQDMLRDLQWGWKVEDYGEEVRFMTGRQREKAETTMERETIMHDLEEEQFEKAKEYQQELWQLEDERYEQQIEHFEEQQELQQEIFEERQELEKQHFEEQQELQQLNLEKQQEFFAERTKLEDQMTELQRKYYEENYKLQEEAIKIQMAAAAEQADYATKVAEANAFLETQKGAWDLLTEAITGSAAGMAAIVEEMLRLFEGASEFIDFDWDQLAKDLEDALSALGLNYDDYTGDSGVTKEQFGTQGMWKTIPLGYPNDTYDIKVSTGEEVFVRRSGGGHIPDPWSETMVTNLPPAGVGGGLGGQNVIVYIGTEEIRDFITETISEEFS